jgi:hypothetical protein
MAGTVNNAGGTVWDSDRTGKASLGGRALKRSWRAPAHPLTVGIGRDAKFDHTETGIAHRAVDEVKTGITEIAVIAPCWTRLARLE